MKKHSADYWILIFAIGLTAFGIIMILSASFYSAKDSVGSYYYALKQLEHALIGVALLIALWNTPYYLLKKASVIAYIVGAALLILVLVAGTNAYGAQRWLNVAGISIQPSDIAKLALVITIASIFSEDRKNISERTLEKNPKLKYKINCFRYLALAAGLTGIYCVLIMYQPNLSTTICLALIMVAMLFTAGINWKWLLLGVVALGVIAVYLMTSASYRLQRFEAFIDPWSDPLGTGYQLIQSLYAIGSGGVIGVGLGQSMQKYLYIPFAESDFIFAIISEETGFIGCLLLFFAFVILIWRGTLVAHRSKDPFAILLASGITSMIAIQTIINLCVVTGAIPPTGIPLPFISYGGSSICIMLASVGILLNISKYTVLPPPRKPFTFKFSKHGIWHS